MMIGLRWGRGFAALVLILPLSGVAGCDQRTATAADTSRDHPAGFDPSARQACAKFRSGWRGATDAPARLQLADTVERSARRSDNAAITQRATVMGRSAEDGGRQWRTAGAELMRACRQVAASPAPPVLPITG